MTASTLTLEFALLRYRIGKVFIAWNSAELINNCCFHVVPPTCFHYTQRMLGRSMLVSPFVMLYRLHYGIRSTVLHLYAHEAEGFHSERLRRRRPLGHRGARPPGHQNPHHPERALLDLARRRSDTPGIGGRRLLPSAAGKRLSHVQRSHGLGGGARAGDEASQERGDHPAQWGRRFSGEWLILQLASPFADILFQSLPSLIVVPGATSQATELQVNMRRFASEFRGTGWEGP